MKRNFRYKRGKEKGKHSIVYSIPKDFTAKGDSEGQKMEVQSICWLRL